MQTELVLLKSPCWRVGPTSIAYKAIMKPVIMHF